MNIQRLVLGELDTNCYVVWDECGKGLVIDPADSVETILAFIHQQNIAVEAIVLTHVHFDHMLAVDALRVETDASVYVGKGDVPAMSDPIKNLSGLFTPGAEITAQWDVAVSEGDELTVGEMTFTVLATPGHTPGCICLLSDDVLFSGDTLFRNSIGRLDFPGGDEVAMVASLQRLIALPGDTKVYSGHGPATTIACEIQRNPFLR